METITTSQPKLTRFDYENYFNAAATYEEYRSNFATELEHLNASPYAQYLPINWQRLNRVEKTTTLTEDISAAVKSLHHHINWLVISEHWCGDAAQSLPVLHRIAQASAGKISLRIVYRDKNLELMDAHLTGTSRSIPKLIQLDTHFNIIGLWGPRPNEAQKLVLQLKADPATAKTYGEAVHKWYAVDKQQSIQKELLKLLQRAALFCPDCIR